MASNNTQKDIPLAYTSVYKSTQKMALDQEAKVSPDDVVHIANQNQLSIINWNPIINRMADLQGYEPGSWNWSLAGPAAWSGSAGEQASYGWRHTHKLNGSYIRAVLANYGHRRCYYQNAPFRQFGYEAAGRPHGWVPETSGDLTNGVTAYFTSAGLINVTGPDAEHLWLTPLFALVDDNNPIEVETGLGNKLPSNLVAKFLATLLVSSAVGMIRDKNGDGQQPYSWTYGDRATGRLLHTIVEGYKRGCLANEDVTTAAIYIRDIVLPFYEKAPGIHTFGEPKDGRFPMGLFNGLHWIVPVCYDAAHILRQTGLTEWADRYMALVIRWSQWMIDMNEVLPFECFRADRVYLHPDFGLQDSVSDSIQQFIRPEDFKITFDFIPWSFRAVDIAAKVTQNSKLIEARDKIIDTYKNDLSKKQWLVDANGNYLKQ